MMVIILIHFHICALVIININYYIECSNECLTCHENPNNCTACSDVAFLNGTKCIILEYYYKDEFNSLFSIYILY